MELTSFQKHLCRLALTEKSVTEFILRRCETFLEIDPILNYAKIFDWNSTCKGFRPMLLSDMSNEIGELLEYLGQSGTNGRGWKRLLFLPGVVDNYASTLVCSYFVYFNVNYYLYF